MSEQSEIRNAAFAACPDAGCDWSSFYRGWLAAREAYDYAALEAECKILRNSLSGSNNQARANKLEAEKFAIDWLKVLEERDALAAEMETLRKDASAEMFLTLTAELAKLRAELAAIKGQEPTGFDYSIRTQSTNSIPAPATQSVEVLVESLMEALEATTHALVFRPSCQRGLVDPCKCRDCALARAGTAMHAFRTTHQQQEAEK